MVLSRFLDVLPKGWETSGVNDTLPVMISRDFLLLYNFGFAQSRNFPLLSEDLLKIVLDKRLGLKAKVNLLPLKQDEHDTIVTQYAMGPVGDLGLLKMDFLGLANLTILGRAIEIIQRTRGETIDLTQLPDVEVVDEGKGSIAQFGLDPPVSQMLLTLSGGKPVTVRFGSRNPSGTAIYAQRDDGPRVYLIGLNVRYYEDLVFQAAPPQQRLESAEG